MLRCTMHLHNEKAAVRVAQIDNSCWVDIEDREYNQFAIFGTLEQLKKMGQDIIDQIATLEYTAEVENREGQERLNDELNGAVA